jgi:hypothetical protein
MRPRQQTGLILILKAVRKFLFALRHGNRARSKILKDQVTQCPQENASFRSFSAQLLWD